MPVAWKESAAKTESIEFLPGVAGIESRPAAPLARTVVYLVALLIATLITWAVFGRLDVIAVADGKLVPQSFLKIVQPADSGIVAEILVKEGEEVQADQVLMRMDTQLSTADSKTVQAELALKSLQLRRIEAELKGVPLKRSAGDPPEVFRQVEAQYAANRQAYLNAANEAAAGAAKARQDLASAQEVEAKLKATMPHYQRQAEAFEKLGKDGFASPLIVADKQRERIEREQDLRAQAHAVAGYRNALEETELRLSQISANYRQQLQKEKVETLAHYQKLEQDWAKQQHRNTLLELKAPQSGIVKDLATHTRGTVVAPGTIVLTLVPKDEPLMAEVWVKNQDAGFVHEGQAVKVKLATYPFQKYGMIEGKIAQVSADASEPGGAKQEGAEGLLAYKAIVALDRQYLESDAKQLKLSPGMRVSAEINQGSRTVLEYLLSPVTKAFHEAARER